MKTKNLIFLTLVFVIVLAGILATIFLISSRPVVQVNPPPISLPVSNPNETIISIEDGDVNDFDIAVITAEDTIELKNTQNERIPVKLDKMSWKDLKWSPDGKLLSVLGETGENIYDLFIFNLNNKTWRKSTNFNQTIVGLGSYVWRDNNVILFTQGTQGEHWIHQYVYASGEITKLTRTEGELVSVSEDGKSLVVKINNNEDATSFAFFKTDGTLIYNLSKVLDTDGNSLVVTNITYTKDPNTIVLTTKDGKLYKHIFGNSNATELTNAFEYNVLCGVSDKTVLGIKVNDEGKIFLNTISVENTPLVNIASADAVGKDVDFSKTKCYKVNNVALNLEGTWFLAKDDIFNEFFAIKGSTEVSFRTI